MKGVFLSLAMIAFASPTLAQNYGYGTGSNSQSHSVNGYVNNNGTYVPPHHQTNPNNTTSDNYGALGNYNPYTGATGRR